MDALARLHSGAEVAVVLGSGDEHDSPSVLRARAAAALAQERTDIVLILSGGYAASTGGPPERSEASVMRDVLRDLGVPDEQVLLEEDSRDTLGNAVFTATRYLASLAPRPLVVVTSPSHLRRAVRIFERVLGPAWRVSGLASDPTDDEGERGAAERDLERQADAFFSGLRAGDLAAMAARLRARYPYDAAEERGGTWST